MSMNVSDRINDFLVEIREHDGFASDKDFDRVAAEVFKQKIKGLIEECATIAEEETIHWAFEPKPIADHCNHIAQVIRALDS